MKHFYIQLFTSVIQDGKPFPHLEPNIPCINFFLVDKGLCYGVLNIVLNFQSTMIAGFTLKNKIVLVLMTAITWTFYLPHMLV